MERSNGTKQWYEAIFFLSLLSIREFSGRENVDVHVRTPEGDSFRGPGGAVVRGNKWGEARIHLREAFQVEVRESSRITKDELEGSWIRAQHRRFYRV